MERLRRRFRATARFAATLAGALVLGLSGCSARESQALAATPPAPTATPAQDQGAQEQPPTKAEGSTHQKDESGERENQETTEPSGASEAPTTPEAASSPGSADSKDKLSKVETTEERREGLDEKLDRSLSEFDALILREQEILEQRREASAAAGGGGGAGNPGVAGDSGAGEDASGSSGESGGSDRSGARAERAGTGGSPDQPAGEPEEPSGEGAPVGGDPGEISNGRVPPDVGDGSDDDIVARQLREAAMNEEDPELREKLWDEYRAYKFGTTGKKDDGKTKQQK